MTVQPPLSSGAPQPFKFYAFISYSHADEAFVKKLQEKIESYRLPSSLHKLREGLPDKLHPLFRDATDLPPGQLSAEIRKKLAESKYLIVVCSPRSAGSYWVGKEIEEFDRLGRHDRIIPVIIDGQVNAADEAGRPDPSRECFPAPLLAEVRQGLDSQLLGVSVPQDGPRKAILKVVAKMLELDPDDLIARDQAREKRRFLTLAAVAFGLVALVLAAAWSYWDYQRETISYYADYTEQWGLPQGLFPIKPPEAAVRASSYRFISQRRKLKEVAHVDSAGRPVPHQNPEFVDRPVFQTFVYEDDSGRLLEARYLDHNRNPLVRLVFSGDNYSAIDFKRVNSENETLQAWLAAQTTSAAGGQFGQTDPGTVRGQVQRWKVRRDERGRMVKIEYKQLESDKPAQDKDGIFGQELTLDEYGRVIKRLYLDIDGRNFTTPMGLAGKAYRYAGADLAETENFDGQNRPALDDRGQMITAMTYDEHGRMTALDSLDRNRALYPDQSGIARKTWRYDQAGRPVEEAYFGLDGRPWTAADGYAGFKIAYDGSSREKSFFGADGALTADRRGVARLRETFDGRGNILETAYYDVAGRPLSGPDGYFKAVNNYDQRGRLIEESFFSPDGRPAAGQQGYARVSRVFNEFGSILEESFWGPDGQPAFNSDGAARVVNAYDEKGAAETVTWLGADGRRVLNRNGYAQLRFKTDTYGRPLALAFYGTDDRPVNSALGYARSEISWNELNRMAELKFYDAEGHPTDPAGGRTAGLKFEYDEEGRQTGAAVIDPSGQIGPTVNRSEPTALDILPESGPVAVIPKLVDFGVFAGKVQAELTLYNLTDQKVILSRALSGQPRLSADYPDGRTLAPRGTVRLVVTCDPPADEGARLDGEAVFIAVGLRGELPLVIPVLGRYNAALLNSKTDSPPSRVIPIIGYNPAKDPSDPFDYSSLTVGDDSAVSRNPDGSRTERVTDERGRLIESQDFDADGGLLARWTYHYNQQGRLTQAVKIDMAADSSTIFFYDENGQITGTREIAADGASMEFTHGEAGVTGIISRDADGRVVKNPWEPDETEPESGQ